jgi:hypothetical protein
MTRILACDEMKRFCAAAHYRAMKRILFLLLLATAVSATPISDRYAQLGGANGFLGVKTSEETSGAGGGKFQHFKNGSIFWHPECGVREVHGLIRDRYKALGWETSFLGYPITDEINLVDGSGKISRFKGGELILRNGASTVSVVKSTDLVVDFPFPAGEAWIIGQTNSVDDSKDSHIGQYAYCWDMNLANGGSGGKLFVASATSRIVFVEQGLASGGGNAGNVVVQRFGEGRYGSYLHIGKGSYTTQFANGPGILFLPQDIGWSGRPVPKTGTPLGEVGDTGTDNHHMHFCVTTAPDRGAFGSFESVPVAFRNYSVSTDQGKTWKPVVEGVPTSGQWVRRRNVRPNPNERIPGAPKVNSTVSVISHGIVKGNILTGDGKPTGPGKLKLTILSAWGEPLASATVDVPANNLNGPWPFQFNKVPAYKGLKLAVSYEGPWNRGFDFVNGSGTAFDLAPNGTATTSAALKTTFIQ